MIVSRSNLGITVYTDVSYVHCACIPHYDSSGCHSYRGQGLCC